MTTTPLTGPIDGRANGRVNGPVVGLMLATVANADRGVVEPSRVVDAARRAEAGGFDGVYVGDHLLHPHPLLESIVTLSVVAAVTERVSLGPCVLLAALRHPLVLAKQLGTLAAYAPGRLRVGIGVGGEYPPEFEAAGVPLAERGRRTESALREVRSLLAGRVGGGDVTIAPGADDIPFLLAGWREVSLRRAATFGDGWIGYLLGPESFGRRRAFLLETRDALGRSQEPFTTGMLVPVHVGDGGDAKAEAAAAWAKLTDAEAGFPERLFAAGSVDEVVEQLHRYWELGCTELVLGPADQGDGYLRQVDRLAQDVLPRVREFA
jgi:alkanesulfonate monooxygenase SsuD/methylene tetrahydromethanopterin reductase-like flavin-dependent oxidoreductase (luciferase family)